MCTRRSSASGSSFGIWYAATYAHICRTQVATSRPGERRTVTNRANGAAAAGLRSEGTASLAWRRISGHATPPATPARATARMALDVRKADPSICTGMELAGTRVAVTGAGGFIGGALCRRLTAEGADVLGLDIDASAADRVAAAGADFQVCDTTDAAAVAAALPGSELVVHTAAIVADYRPVEGYGRGTVRGT